MISNINPLVIWIYLIYITLSIDSIPFLIGYAVYKLINLIKKRRKNDCIEKITGQWYNLFITKRLRAEIIDYDSWLFGSFLFWRKGSETVENYEKAEQDYMAGMKYAEIAEKYGTTVNTVKSWKQRYKWERKKGAHKNEKVCTQKKKKVCIKVCVQFYPQSS